MAVKKSLLAGSAMCAVGVLMMASPGRAATIALGFSEPGDSITYNLLTTSSSGSASFGPAGEGTFTGVTVTATGVPTLVSPGLQTTNVSTTGASNSAETANVFITQSGLTSPLGILSLLSSFNVSTYTIPTQIASVTISTFVNPDNALGEAGPATEVLLGTVTCTTTCTSSSTNNTPNLTTTYSETVEYTFVTTGNPPTGGQLEGTVDASANISSATPVPAALPLFGTGLGVVGLLGWRRRRKINNARVAA